MRNDRSPGVACSLIRLLTTYTKRYNDDGDNGDDDDVDDDDDDDDDDDNDDNRGKRNNICRCRNVDNDMYMYIMHDVDRYRAVV